MKKFFSPVKLSILAGALIFSSCNKPEPIHPSPENKPPTAVAGPDQVITLPTDSVSLDGTSSSDPDGKINEWRWQKISGPASFTINAATTTKTVVKNLVTGAYQFELTVKDNGGLSAKDTIQVIVEGGLLNHLPIANAGSDTVITLPANTVNLDGSGSSDPDNNSIGYVWTKISGPSSFSITNANTVQTQVTNLVEGVYLFELKITDTGGLFDKDTVQITVNTQLTSPPPACDNSNRPIVNAQLIPIGTLSQARREMAVASAGNKILFAGGHNNDTLYSRVDIFDAANNTWSTSELSLPRIWIAPVTAGNKIFFAGGQLNDGGGTWFGSSTVDIYDVTTNTWAVSHLSRSDDNLAAATVGNKVFFAGGNMGMYCTGTVDIYDLTTNTWSIASLSTPRNFVTAASANSKVYFAGGELSNGQRSYVIDEYDNTTGIWSTPTLQFPGYNDAAVAFNDVVYFGGVRCSVEALNANTEVATLLNLSSPDGFWPAVVKDNKIIFILHNATGAYSNKFDIYDIQSNTWSIGFLPQPIPTSASIISVNNTIYVAGGSVNGVLSNQVWKLEF